MFGADLVIDNLEIDLVASQIEAVHNGVVGCNVILVLIDLEGGYKNCVVITMVGGQNILITPAISDMGRNWSLKVFMENLASFCWCKSMGVSW